MKKILILFFIFLNLLFFSGFVNAQCGTVTVALFQPSAGHYKVRATIPIPYNQNIELMGSITPEGESTTGYELTIYAGNLTGETDQTWQQSTPPSFSNSYISVCPTASDYLNFAGQLHNDYQEYILDYIVSLNVDLTDTNSLRQTIQSKTEDFFEPNGINVNDPIAIRFANGGNSYQFSTSGFSSAGASILNSLKTFIENYDPENDASFFTSLDSLQQLALSLSDPTEVYAVGIPVTVAIYSFDYWKDNADRWADIFYEQDSIRNHPISYNRFSKQILAGQLLDNSHGPNAFNNYFDEKLLLINSFKKCNINLWKLGGADVGGAVHGGVTGLAFGPGGAFAGAVLESAVGSLGNLTNQVISCYVSWWPF